MSVLNLMWDPPFHLKCSLHASFLFLLLYIIHIATQGHYQYNVQELNWVDAEAACLAEGGHLASLHSKAENDVLMDYLDHIDGAQDNVWIGANDFDVEVQYGTL